MASVESPDCTPDGGPGGEAALQNCPRPETPKKVMSLLVVSGGSGVKDKSIPGLPQIGPPLTSTPQLQARSELGDQGSVQWDCKGPEEGPVPAPPTGQGVPAAQGRLTASSGPDSKTVPETLKVPMAAAMPTAQTPPTNPVLPAAPKVPETQMMAAAHEERAASEVPSVPTKPEAQVVQGCKWLELSTGICATTPYHSQS